MKLKSPALKWIKAAAKPVIPGVALISLVGILEALCGVALALQSKYVVDYAVAKNIEQLKFSAVLLAAFIALQFLLSFSYMKLSADIVAKHTLRLQREVFSHIVNMSFEKASEFRTGELLNRITTDSDTVMCGCIGIIPALVAFVTGIVSSVFALLVIQPSFALVCIGVGLVIGLGAVVWGRRLKKHTLICRKWTDKNNSFMLECMRNLLVIKSFENEKRAVKYSKSIQDDTYKALKKRNNNNIMASLVSDMAFTFGYFLALGWGAFGIAMGTLSYGNLMAMVQLVGKIQSPFKGIASVIPQYYQMLASAERLMEVVNFDEIKENVNIEDFESIEFKNVTFSYNNKEIILNNANLDINKGEFVLISGASGIGKSTLMKLLLAVYKPTVGSIVVKNDGAEYVLSAGLRKLFSYVPQGNMVISGTVAENVVFFDEKSDSKKIEECLKTAQLWEDISAMPDGVNTRLGENGMGLSEGQVQRLAVARALYRDTPILLLDEATSALDSATEAKMLESIRNLKDKTCIFISHKKGGEKLADRQIVLREGSIMTL